MSYDYFDSTSKTLRGNKALPDTTVITATIGEHVDLELVTGPFRPDAVCVGRLLPHNSTLGIALIQKDTDCPWLYRVTPVDWWNKGLDTGTWTKLLPIQKEADGALKLHLKNRVTDAV